MHRMFTEILEDFNKLITHNFLILCRSSVNKTRVHNISQPVMSTGIIDLTP